MESNGIFRKTKWIMTKTFQTTDYANICTIDHTQNVFISHLTLYPHKVNTIICISLRRKLAQEVK